MIVSLQGNSRAAFEQSWSMIVRMVSFPLLSGSLVMKSIAIVPKGVPECSGGMGKVGIFCLFVLGFVNWHVAQP